MFWRAATSPRRFLVPRILIVQINHGLSSFGDSWVMRPTKSALASSVAPQRRSSFLRLHMSALPTKQLTGNS